MTREEYNRLKDAARELMVEDYQWLLRQESGAKRWRATKRWLIEFVHDVSDRLNPMDEIFRPIPLQRLYEAMFCQLGITLPHHPSKALSKLRGIEHRRRIEPDFITLFYMKHIGERKGIGDWEHIGDWESIGEREGIGEREHTENPEGSKRIIELLME